MRLLALLSSVSLATLLVTGCSTPSSPSPSPSPSAPSLPSTGRGDFQYDETDCAPDCAVVDHPMMRGTAETLYVRAASGTLPVLDARSTSPAVVVESSDFMCCNEDAVGIDCRGGSGIACHAGEVAQIMIEVTAASAGKADLVLTNADGSEWDHATVEVAEAARLSLTCAGSEALTVGDECTVGWTAFDASRRMLEATTGVVLTVTPADVAAFDDVFAGRSSSVAGDLSKASTSVTGLGAGDAELRASAGQATATMPLHVRAN
jgi:hypothetical protein